MKLILVILDGAADKPVKQFHGLTPYEMGKTPNLDFLAGEGITGMIRIMKNYAPETDSGVMALFGYDPLKYLRGRGPLEVYGSGGSFKKGDLALRCNFATLVGRKIIDVRAGRIKSKEAKKLVDSLQENLTFREKIKFKLLHVLNYRFVMTFRSKKKLSDQISNTHPGYVRKPGYLEIAVKLKEKKIKKCKPLDKKKSSIFTSKLVNEFTEKSFKILKDHPINKSRKRKGLMQANYVLMRGAGLELPRLEDFKKKYKLSWLCIADTPAEKGIARLVGMRLAKLPEPKCDLLSPTTPKGEIKKFVKYDMRVRVKKLLDNFDRYDAFYVHLKGPDPFAHAGKAEKKKLVIEGIDEYFFGKLLEEIDLKKTVIAVTSDHTTACSARAHTNDPVPLVVAGGKVIPDRVKKFGESYCKKGKLGTFNATEFMKILMRLIK